MSDVITPITQTPTPDPYFDIQRKAYAKIIEKYGYGVRNNREMIEKAIYGDDVILDECQQVVRLYGYKQLEKFKKTIARQLRCFIAVDQNTNVLKWKKVHWPCGSKSCDRCSPRKADENLAYAHDYVLMGECEDHDTALEIVGEINSVLAALDIDYVPVTMIPSHDETKNYIAVACLRRDELNFLIEENEVKKAIKMVAENWPGLEEVDRVSSKNKYESTYITRTSNIVVTTTDLYLTIPHGRSAKRQKLPGTKRGLVFEKELGEVVHYTKAELQKKRDDEDGTVLKFNSPSASNQVPHQDKDKAMRRALIRTSCHKEFVAFQSESNADLVYNVNRLSAIYIEELEDMGHTQPDVQTAVRLTQADIDQYNALVAIPRAGTIPDNILDIEFTNLDRKTYGLLDLIEKIHEEMLASAQKKIRQNIAIDDLVKSFIQQVEEKPPS